HGPTRLGEVMWRRAVTHLGRKCVPTYVTAKRTRRPPTRVRLAVPPGPADRRSRARSGWREDGPRPSSAPAPRIESTRTTPKLTGSTAEAAPSADTTGTGTATGPSGVTGVTGTATVASAVSAAGTVTVSDRTTGPRRTATTTWTRTSTPDGAAGAVGSGAAARAAAAPEADWAGASRRAPRARWPGRAPG